MATREDEYYFGHIANDQATGRLEIKYANGTTETRQYSIEQNDLGFQLHIGNIDYVIEGINDRRMRLREPAGQVMIKLPPTLQVVV